MGLPPFHRSRTLEAAHMPDQEVRYLQELSEEDMSSSNTDEK
jgi:hypothetical protein